MTPAVAGIQLSKTRHKTHPGPRSAQAGEQRRNLPHGEELRTLRKKRGYKRPQAMRQALWSEAGSTAAGVAWDHHCSNQAQATFPVTADTEPEALGVSGG